MTLNNFQYNDFSGNTIKGIAFKLMHTFDIHYFAFFKSVYFFCRQYKPPINLPWAIQISQLRSQMVQHNRHGANLVILMLATKCQDKAVSF